MIANSAFLAAMVLLLLAFWVWASWSSSRRTSTLILPQHLWVIVGALVVVFLNLFALFYLAGRGLFLKDTGRKLAHVERQLRTPDTIVRDLSERLARGGVSRMSRGSRDDRARRTPRRTADPARGPRSLEPRVRTCRSTAWRCRAASEREPVAHARSRLSPARIRESRSSRPSARSASCRAADLADEPIVARTPWTGDLRRLCRPGPDRARTSRDQSCSRRASSCSRARARRSSTAAATSHRAAAAAYHAGLVKPRELAHDAQLYRLYQAEAASHRGRGRTHHPRRPRLRIEARLPDVSEPARPADGRRRRRGHRRPLPPPTSCP